MRRDGAAPILLGEGEELSGSQTLCATRMIPRICANIKSVYLVSSKREFYGVILLAGEIRG